MTQDETTPFIAPATAEFGYLPDGGNDIAMDADTCMRGLDAMTGPCGCFEHDHSPEELPKGWDDA